MDSYGRTLPYDRGLSGDLSALYSGGGRCPHGGLWRSRWICPCYGSFAGQESSGVPGDIRVGTQYLVEAAGCEANQLLSQGCPQKKNTNYLLRKKPCRSNASAGLYTFWQFLQDGSAIRTDPPAPTENQSDYSGRYHCHHRNYGECPSGR